MTLEEGVGTILKKYRILSRLSQEELALLAGIDRTYVGIIERGETKVTLNMIAKLCGCFNVKLSIFFTEVEELMSNK